MNCTIATTGAELLLKCKNENEMPYPAIKGRLRNAIWELYCNGVDAFYLNCEYGVPLWAAEIICALKMYNDIELHIMIPYEEQSINWCEEYRDRYFAVHAQSDSVDIIRAHYYQECYKDTDKKMLDASDVLVVFGSSQKKIYAAEYAESNGISIQYFELDYKY